MQGDFDTDKPLTEEELALARKGEALIKSVVTPVQAPQSLRESIERERGRASTAPALPFWRRRWVAVAAGAAVVLVGFAVALQSGGSSGSSEPTFAALDAVSTQNPAEAAPATLGGDPPVLAANVGYLQFPDWQKKFGWTAVGQREDEVDGRAVTTVFYRNEDGAQLGYSVVAGAPLEEQPAGQPIQHEGKTYHVTSEGSQQTIAWTQQGHTCVMVAPTTVKQSKLVELAASRNV
jgi:hypothetical protein